MAKQHELDAKKAQRIDSCGPDGLAQMVIDLTAECEELTSDVEYAKCVLSEKDRDANQSRRDLAEVKADRDALAARVERLRSALEYSCVYLDESRLNSIGSGSKAHMEMDSVLHESLDYSDARVRAKAIRALAEEIEDGEIKVIESKPPRLQYWTDAGAFILAYAQRLIDEAEGGEL